MIDRLLPPRHRRRRRFRTRLLLSMLAVGLVPLSLLAVVVVADLGSVSRTTADEANRTLIAAQEADQQRQVLAGGRVLQVTIDNATTQLQKLRQQVIGALRSAEQAAPPAAPVFDSVGQLRYLHQKTSSGTLSTVLVAPLASPSPAPAQRTPPGGPASTGATAPSLANPSPANPSVATEVAVTAAVEPGMETVRNIQGVLAVWIADTATGLVRVLPDLDVAGAIDRGSISPSLPLREGTSAPFSAVALRTDAALGTQQTWDGEAGAPQDLAGRPSFSTAYRTAGGGLGVTVWEPGGLGSHASVGMDLEVRTLVSSVSDTPVTERHGAATLLLGGGDQLLGASPGAAGALGLPKDFVGTALPASATALRRGLDPMLTTGTASPLRARLGNDDDELFMAPIRSAHWVLVSAVPYADLVPDQAALSRGVDSGVHHILVDLIPLTVGAVALAVLLAGLSARRAVGPLKDLTVAAERLGSGRTDDPVPSLGRDEFGLLSHSLERMRREVNTSRDAILAAARELEGRVADRTTELRERNEELVSLNRLAGSLTRSLEPDAILAGGLESLDAFLPMRTGRGFVIDEGRLRALVSHGDAAADTTPLAAVAGAALEGHDLAMREDTFSILVGLPLETREGALGAIALRVDAGWRPDGRLRALLRAVADQVGLALRTAMLSAEGRELAVLEERTRLAREIHDTLAQQLTGIVLQLEAAEALVERDEPRARGLVVAAREQARFALAEARRSVWNLRPQPLEATGLAGAVALEAARFSRRSGVPVRVASNALPQDLALTPQAEVAVFRILQEALTNAERHSNAHRVEVELAPSGDELLLTITDDGDGFAATGDDNPAPGSFGLIGMEERARLIGSSLRVASTPGQGTRVEVRLPLGSAAEGVPV
ncbi:MAG TPA: histidine kinase [Candidatus Dormibacteraeota bacterium]